MVGDFDSYDLYLDDDLEFPKQRHITNYRLFRYALKTNHDSASDDPRIVSTYSAMISPFEMGRDSWDELEYTYELIGDLLPIHNRQGVAPKKNFLQRVTDYYVQLDATDGRSERTVWITTNREDGTKYKLVGDCFKHYSSRCMKAIKRMMAADLLSSNYLHDMVHDRAYRISNFSLIHLDTGTQSELIKPPADYGKNYRLTGKMILSNSNSSKNGFLPVINVRATVKGEYVIDFGRDALQVPQFWLKHCDGGKFVLEEPCHPDYQQLYDRAMTIDSYNWQTDPNNQDQVWRHITNYHLTDIKGNLHTLEINDDPDEVFILWGDLMPPEDSNCPLLRTRLFVGCFNIDYGESIDDINRGLWMKSMENWYKLEKPSTDYRSIANSLCVKVQHFSELYDALIYLDEETCTYHEATGKYVCAFTIQEVQQRALTMGGKPFSMPFVRDNWVFIAQFLDAVLDWKHSSPLRRSIKDLRDENTDLQPQAHPDVAVSSLSVGAPSLVTALKAKGLSNSTHCSDGPSVVRMSNGVHGVHSTGSSSASNVVRVLDRTSNSSDKSSQQRNTSGGAASVYTGIHTDRKPTDLGNTASFDNTLHMRPQIQLSSANKEYPRPVVLGSKGMLNLQSNEVSKDKVRLSEGKATDHRSIARTISNDSDDELFPPQARTTVASKIKRKAESLSFSSPVSEEGTTVQRLCDRSSLSEHHNTSISPVPSLHRSAQSIQGKGTLSRAVRGNGVSIVATGEKRSADPSWETGRDKYTAKADRYNSNRDRRLDDIYPGKEDRPELRTFCRYCKCKEKKPKCRNEGHLDGCFYQLPHSIQRFDSGSQKYSNKSSYGGESYQHKSRPLSSQETSVDACGSKSSRALEQAPWTKRSSVDATYHGQYTVMKEDNLPSVDHCLDRDATDRTANDFPRVMSITPVDPKIVALNPSTINRPAFSEPLDVPLVKLGNAPRDPLVRHGARTTELGNGVYVTSKGSTGPRSPSMKSNCAPFSGSQHLGVVALSGSQSSSAAALSGSQSSSAAALSGSQPLVVAVPSGSQPSIVAPSSSVADSAKVRRVAWADMKENGRLTSVCGD